MDQNLAAINALKEYVEINKPGYAFMIEAPWGAGKTHLVKHEFKDSLLSDKARYISLNGVSERRAFRRALLAGASVAKLTDAAGKFGNTFGKIANIGKVGSLAQDFIENRMIDNLPDILIFDDVERCEMATSELLGLINNFVEHQKKNVVLCAFIERENGPNAQKKPDNFLSRKEKVVGRTVRIVADAQNALPNFIRSMPNGEGKQWFQSNETLVLEVFSDAGHNNLRVLRQCLHDCGRVIDVLEEDIRLSTDAMIRFVRTYLVLAMALSTGEIDSKDLRERSNHQWVMGPKKGEEPHPLFNCNERHQHVEIFAGNAASIFPLDLGISLIGIGYETSKKINEALRTTGQFSGEQEIPLWRRFVEWRQLPMDELEDTYDKAKAYVFENELIEPGPYLHLANGLISIAEFGFGNTNEISTDIINRIASLKENKKIPAAPYGLDFGWHTDGGSFSFGGYGFPPDKNTAPIIETMRDAQMFAFKEIKTKEAERLLDLLDKNLEKFEQEITGGTRHQGYFDTAILDKMDECKFAAIVFNYITSGNFEAIGRQMKALTDRHRSNIIDVELSWAEMVKAELSRLADEAGPIEKARMNWFLRYFWKFPVVNVPNKA